MSCNNTNNTCTQCNHNYSSCNNNCTKCGCKDSFLTSPPPCPTPAGCPDPIPCQEVLSSDCIIYGGPDITCNGDTIIYSDSTWTEVLEDIVAYFCLTSVPEILCGTDIVVTEDSSINEAFEQIVEYFCGEIEDINENIDSIFGTAFRGYISPPNINFVLQNLPNSNISSGIDVIFSSPNGVIEYQLVNGVTTSQYNQTTGIWTCPQTGRYDINYNVYLSAPNILTNGWGDLGGTFTIGVTDPTGLAIIYCADVISFIRNVPYSKIYLTGGIQGKELTVGTQLKLKVQNMTGINYDQEVSLGDNIDWAIRRVG